MSASVAHVRAGTKMMHGATQRATWDFICRVPANARHSANLYRSISSSVSRGAQSVSNVGSHPYHHRAVGTTSEFLRDDKTKSLMLHMRTLKPQALEAQGSSSSTFSRFEERWSYDFDFGLYGFDTVDSQTVFEVSSASDSSTSVPSEVGSTELYGLYTYSLRTGFARCQSMTKYSTSVPSEVRSSELFDLYTYSLSTGFTRCEPTPEPREHEESYCTTVPSEVDSSELYGLYSYSLATGFARTTRVIEPEESSSCYRTDVPSNVDSSDLFGLYTYSLRNGFARC